MVGNGVWHQYMALRQLVDTVLVWFGYALGSTLVSAAATTTTTTTVTTTFITTKKIWLLVFSVLQVAATTTATTTTVPTTIITTKSMVIGTFSAASGCKQLSYDICIGCGT